MSMRNTIQMLCQKGILAADESIPTMGKRFSTIGLENNETNRKAFRSLITTTPELNRYISGVILHEETFRQKNDSGKPLTKILIDQDICIGIKVDQGLIALDGTAETVTAGLDHLPVQLATYKRLGACFAKWRATFKISAVLPSSHAIHINAFLLARYARICQIQEIVPIVEPEVLMDGGHNFERCAVVTETVLTEVFAQLKIQGVSLEKMLLKPNMILSGTEHPQKTLPQSIAKTTLSIFKRVVPSAMPGIYFLSGGQNETEATENLEAFRAFGPHPWKISFSYGRALQRTALATWRGKIENQSAAQTALLKRACINYEAIR